MRLALGFLTCFVLFGGLTLWVLNASPPTGDFVLSLDDTRPLPQGDVYVSNLPEPRNLNPFTSKDRVALGYVLRFTHDCLMERDGTTGELMPALAELVERSEDGLRYEFRLREGLRFSDGALRAGAGVRDWVVRGPATAFGVPQGQLQISNAVESSHAGGGEREPGGEDEGTRNADGTG